MRLTTWNVNGIRNPFSYQPWSTTKTFPAMFDILEADIVVMQELKIQRKDLRDDMVMLDGWDCYFSLPRQKKGYSGVGIYTRNATCSPIRAEEGILGVLTPPNSTTQYRNLPESQQIGGYPSEFQVAELGVDPFMLDSEGRCVCLEFPAFVLFGVYSPANSNGLRDDFRHAFISALDCRIRNLNKMGKRVVLVGDLNVSRTLIDTASSTDDVKRSGLDLDDYTDAYISTPVRRIFNQLIINGEVAGERDEGREEPVLLDTVREFFPERKGMYTHWEQKINARPGNFGSRIDFVLISGSMRDWIVGANIQEGLMGSDHCPVYGEFKDLVTVDSNDGSHEVKLVDIMNPPGVFCDGVRQKDWNIKELPSFSARLMPEFAQRRSIKDMFKKVTAAPASSAASSQDKPAATLASNDIPAITDPPSSASISLPTTASPTKPFMASPPDRKRKASDAPATQTIKKQKPAPSSTTKSAPSRGQKSLKGFFQPKSKPTPENIENEESDEPFNTATVNGSDMRMSGTVKNLEETVGNSHISTVARTSSQLPISDSVSTTKPISVADAQASPAASKSFIRLEVDDADEMVYDPIVNKESWQTLFRKPAAPLCEGHEEPCKTMQTKKKGENQGRSFFMCARPLGPSGAKEKGTQWRCPTFIWCSDWKSGDAR